MKATLFFLLALCFNNLVIPQPAMEKQPTQYQDRQISEKPSVYDIRVWYDPALPCGRNVGMYYGLDSSELRIDFPDTTAAEEQLIHAAELYDAYKYNDAIEVCEKILSLPKRNDDLFEIKTRFLMGTSFLRREKNDFKRRDFKKAFDQFQMALDILLMKKETSYKMAGQILNNMGYGIAKEEKYHPKAIAYLKRSIDFFSKAGIEEPHPYFNIAILSPAVSPADTAMHYMNEALRIISSKDDGKSNLQLARYYMWQGRTHWEAGEIETSFDYYNKVVDIYTKIYGKNHPSLVDPYVNIAWCTYYPNYPDLALTLGEKALAISLKHYGPDHSKNGAIYNLIGLCHMAMGSSDIALLYFEKRLMVEKPNIFYPSIIIRTYNNIGLCHIEKKNYDIGIDYLKKAIKIFKTHFGNAPSGVFGYYQNLAYAYKEKQDHNKAEEYYNIALSMAEEAGGPCTVHVAAIYCEIGLNYQASDEMIKARLSYEQALSSLECYNGISNLTGGENMYNLTLLYTLNGQARIYLSLWEKMRLEEDLDASLFTFQQAVTLIDRMQQDYRKAGSKNRLSNILSEIQAIYEGAIDCYVDKYMLTGQKTFLERAFELSEKSKALLLLEEVKESRAGLYADIPDSLFQLEQSLKTELIRYRKKRFKEEQNGKITDQTGISEWSSIIFDLRQEYDRLIRRLEAEYPLYQQEKSDLSSLSVEQVQQQLLQPGQALLEYFEGYGSIYAFVITADTFYVKKIPIDFPLEMWIENLRSGMYDFFMSKELPVQLTYEKKKELYVESAYGLYRKLIAPLGPLPEELVIIPDGILGYIPFEALLYSEADKTAKIASCDFLIKKHQISYNYSATLWQEMQEKQYGSSGLLAFAPEFEAQTQHFASIDEVRGDALGPLEYNDDEVQYIQRLLGGKALYGNEANASNFRALAPDYSILHLSTHAKLNDRHTDYSFLAFTEQEDGNDQFFISDLYNMRLPADMVVLSACETGIGKLQRGEGILSFARAFSSAGAKSIITSMWKANDESTFEIMKSFYKHLHNGETKSEALRAAKLEYLASHKDKEAHPFYWATFIPIGDMSGITVGAGTNVLYWVAIPVVLLLLLGIYLRLRNSEHQRRDFYQPNIHNLNPAK